MVNDLLTEQQALDTIQRFERLPHQERVSAAERLRAYKAAREAEGGPLFPTQAKAQQERYLALETLHLDKWDDYLDYLPQEQRNILDTQARRRPLAEFQRDVANRAFIEFATGKPVGVDYHAKMRQVGRTVLGLEGDVTPEAFNAAARERLTQRRAARESLVGAATAAQQAALAGVPRHQALSAYQKEAGAADDQTSAIFRRTHQEWEQKTERLRLPMERILRRMAARARPVNQPNAPPLLDTLDIAAEIAALPRDDQNLALQMINAMAREVGVNPERGVPGNEALATRRFFQNLGDGLTRWLGIAMETVRGAETLTEQFSPELQKAKEEARANRRILEIERRLSQIAQGTLDPIELQTEGWLPQLLESGLYATPQVFGFTATVGLGGAGGAFAATSYIAEENAKELLAEFPDMEDDTATAIGSVAAVPEMLLERFQAKEFLTSFKATRELLNRMTRGKLAGSLPRRIAAVTAAGAIQENVTEGIQDLTLPATQAYADGMNWLIGQIAPALARDVPSVDWGRELREWAGTRPEVFVSILPLVLIGAGGAAYRDFQGGELIIKNPELLRHVGFDEATISQITRMEPQEAQQAIVDNWQTRDTRSTAEITAGLVEREAARRRAVALGERAEALPEIRRQPGGGYQVAYPDGSAVQVGTYDAAAELRREWRGRNIDRMMNATVDMVEFYERIRSDRTQVLTNEFRTLQDVLEEQLGKDPTLDRGVLESRLWERVRILEEATNTVRSPDADLSNYPVLGDNVLEFKEKVLSGVIRLNQGATPVDVIQENAELDIKRWIAEGRVTEERVREMLQEWEQTSGDKVLTGETTQDLVEAWSAMASSYAVARYKPEDAGEPIEGWTSTLRGILEKYRALLMGVMQRALLVEKARAEGTLGQDLETYLSEAVGLSSEIGVRRQAVREVGDLLGRTDFSVNVTAAPTREDNLSSFKTSDMKKRAASTKFAHLSRVVSDAAEAYGVEIENRHAIIGGWFTPEVKSLEVPETLVLDTDFDTARQIAAIVGASAPEVQNAVMVTEPAGHDAADAVMVSATLKAGKVDAFIAAWQKRHGEVGFSYDPTTRVFSTARFGEEGKPDSFDEHLEDWHQFLTQARNEGWITKSEAGTSAYVRLAFVDEGEYRRILQEARADAAGRGDSREEILDVVDRAEERLDAYERAERTKARAQTVLPTLPQPASTVSSVLEDAPGQFDNIRRFGDWLDARFAEKFGRREFKVGDKRGRELAIEGLVYDVVEALSRDGSGEGWYNEKVRAAINELQRIHPELENDPLSTAVYFAILATTSQGYTVVQNFEIAEALYSWWKDTGRIPIGMKFANANEPINANLEMIQEILDVYGGEAFIDFMDAEVTGGQLRDDPVIGQPTGVTLQDVVRGNRILGPKIGSFFNNLRGRFDTVTMDLWFTRSMHRYLGGTKASLTGKKVRAALDRFKDELRKEIDSGGRTYGLKKKDIASAEKTIDAALKVFNQWTQDGYPRYGGSYELEKAARTVKNEGAGMKGAPQNKTERQWFESIVRDAKARLEELGFETSEADIQAIVWFAEKNLFAKLTPASDSAKPADYLDAAMVLRDKMIQGGTKWGEKMLDRARAETERAFTNIDFSIADREYLDVVSRGDMEAAQRMVDAAARRAGYETRWWQGGNGAIEGENFDPSRGQRGNIAGAAYLTDNRRVAWFYATHGGLGERVPKKERVQSLPDRRPRMSRLAVNYKNPFKGDLALGEYKKAVVAVRGERGWVELLANTEEAMDAEATGREIDEGVAFEQMLDQADYAGNDTEAFGDNQGMLLAFSDWEVGQEILSQGSYDSVVYEDQEAAEALGIEGPKTLVPLSPNQIKSADPVTYDERGEVIPLSQRFDKSRAEINFSIAGPDYFERLAGVVSGYMSDPDTRRAVYLEALRRLHNLRERLRGGLDEGTAEEHIATIQEDYDQEIAAVRQGRENELAQLSRDLEYERGAAEPGEREAISERYAGQRALVRERAKQQIETLQAQRKSDIRAARAAQREGDTVQVLAAYQAVMAAMPPEVRSRVGGFVRVAQARTIEARRKILLDRIARADVLLDKSLRRSYLDQIDAVLARSKPTGKGSETRKQPKLDVATDRIFKAVRRWAKLDPQEATAELQQVTAWLQAPTEPEGSDLHNRKLIEFQVGQRLAGYQDFDPVGLDQLLGWLTDLYGQGRVLKKMVDDARRQWVADTREAVVADVQSIPGRRSADAQTSEYSVLGRAARFFDEHLASWQLLQSTYGRASKFVADVNSRIRKATHARNDAMLALQAEMEQLFRVVFGTTSRVQWQRELYDLKKRKTWKVEIPQNVTPVQEARAVPADKAEEILAGRLKDPLYADPQNRQALADAVAQNNARARPSRNVRVQVQVASPDLGPATMSDLEALYIIQTWRQANYRVAREAHGWTQDMIDAIEAEIDPRVWPIDAYLRRKYDEGWSELNRTYVAMFGTDMPRIANYAPGRVLHGGEDRASDPADVSGVGSAFGAVMTRVSHTNAFRQEDALSVFLSHRAQADHWRFFAPIIRDLRAVLMSPEAKTAVTRRHGEVTQRQVQTWISALEDDGIRAANGVIAAKKFIDRMMSSNARVVLGMKIGTLVKQANAAAASMLQIPVSEWAYSFGRVVTGQASARYGDLLKSSTIRRRIESGYSPEVRAGRAAWHETPKTYLGGLANRGLDAGVAPIGHVDAWFTTVSALIAYDYHYRKTGNREYALDQMDRVVFETAQPADTANRSLVELQAGGAGKMLFMFASEPRKQLAALWLAAKQVRRGEISGAEFARVAFVSLVLMPAITTVAYSFYRDLLLGRDDDEWGPEDLLIGTALNMPFTGTYLAGPAADSLVRYLLGERVYDSSENILNAVTIRAGSTGKKIAKGEADLDDVGRLIRELGRVFSTFSLPGVGYTVYDQVAEIIESLGD